MVTRVFNPSRFITGIALLMSSAAYAAQTDIANTPIGTTSSLSAKPNIMFVLDDSGSMNWSFMPDALGSAIAIGTLDLPYANTYGYNSAQCNGVGYDPNYTYQPPLNANGTLFANAVFAAAHIDGYDPSSATTNLNNSIYYTYDKTAGSQTAMNWTYTGNGVDMSTTFYRECLSIVGAAPGNAVFKAVKVTSTSSEAQNYANWYSYYRKRYLSMRSAGGRAFSTLDSNYRVGFSVISDTGVTAGTHNFLDAADFGATQKASFYSSLYGSPSNGTTPLRQTLSKIGQYFAKKASGQTVDPVQYSCQRNFAILATDGYWNGAAGTQLDGNTTVGQQDGTEARPMADGNYPASTVNNTWGYWEWHVAPTTGMYKCSSSTYATYTYPVTMSETDQVVNGITMPALTGAYTYASTTSSAVICRTAAQLAAAGLNGVGAQAADGSTYFVSSDPLVFTPTPYQKVISSSGAAPAASTGPYDTLADVTEYYYKTPLRTAALGNCSGALGSDVCGNTVPPNGLDSATWQHMTTYTIGLGVNGLLPFDPDYQTKTTGSYAQLTAGTTNWPVPDGGAGTIDDLWHAAVNGRGRYFSASNSNLMAQSLSAALADTTAVKGTGAGAGVSSVQPVQGANNEGFVSSFRTYDWTGDVQAHPMNVASGAIDSTVLDWSAQAQLDAQSASSRTIYYLQPTPPSATQPALRLFNLTNLTDDGYNGAFDKFCSQPSVAAQCATLTAAQLTSANSGDNLVNYLRGDAVNEVKANSATPLYRARKHKLGDIVNAAPSYVGPPRFSYADSGYADFVSAQATRKPVVYAAANDGMLHAFSDDPADGAAEGNELWAYIPTMVLPKLYRLADTAYPSKHQFFVDATPVQGDIQAGGSWKTILVGGLGAGGSGYYALDITSPTSPKALWEFTDPNLGLSYGNPIIAKLKDGTWIVALTSGLNNADGLGHLFVLNANTGAKLADLVTTAGAIGSPSGLMKIGAYVDDLGDNTAMYFYGGDQLGNLWRFDVDHRISKTGTGVGLLATFQISATTPQPITTAPFPIQISSGSGASATRFPGVLVTTGRYLGITDISDKTQQSIYVVKDPLTADGLGDVRAGGQLATQTVTIDGSSNTLSTASPIDWSTAVGWKLDLPVSGERIVVDPVVQFSAVALISTIPGSGVCPPTAGTSSLYLLNVATGASLLPASAAFVALSQTAVGVGWNVVGNGNVIQITNGDGSGSQQPVPTTSVTVPLARRTSWRELVD